MAVVTPPPPHNLARHIRTDRPSAAPGPQPPIRSCSCGSPRVRRHQDPYRARRISIPELTLTSPREGSPQVCARPPLRGPEPALSRRRSQCRTPRPKQRLGRRLSAAHAAGASGWVPRRIAHPVLPRARGGALNRPHPGGAGGGLAPSSKVPADSRALPCRVPSGLISPLRAIFATIGIAFSFIARTSSITKRRIGGRGCFPNPLE